MSGTTIPALSDIQLGQRIVDDFPHNWAGDAARQPGGKLFALFQAIGLQFEALRGQTAYALAAARLATATAPELDEASLDFFGGSLPRPPGMNDADYYALIKANLFRKAVTRESIAAAIVAFVGVAPTMIELWKPSDTGCFGTAFFDVCTPDIPSRWGAPELTGMGLIEVPGYPDNSLLVHDVINRFRAAGVEIYVRQPNS